MEERTHCCRRAFYGDSFSPSAVHSLSLSATCSYSSSATHSYSSSATHSYSLSAAHSLSPTPQYPPTPIAVISGMGRRRWATPEQVVYLKSFLHRRQQAKETTGLKALYEETYDGFFKKWGAEPVKPVPGVIESEAVIVANAKKKLYNVRTMSDPSCSWAYGLPAHR